MTLVESNDAAEAIAIIGMSGCFPGAPNVERFWENLRNGVESISFFDDDEIEAAPTSLAGTKLVKAKGTIPDSDMFDAEFFGFTPREAEDMDPQQRLFLERGWEALECAGYDAESFPGSIGVFAGVSANSYFLYNMYKNRLVGQFGPSDKDFLATRLSYKLNLRGPSLTIQTACSTSLVAVSVACQNLLGYQCDIALAGGATIGAPIKSGYLYAEGGVMSPDGHCRAFDAKGRGFVPGNGVGLVVLKRLSEALADGDSIDAVIIGSAVNNDGSAKVGYTAPGIDGQAEVIAMAQALAGIDAETISYVEAHGTGTELGDPIEIAALTRAFRYSTKQTGFCAIGSAKTNIGHLDVAAGVSGLIKVAMALKNREIPPSLHFEEANPTIDFANSPFFVNTQLTPWKSSNGPRRAGVSSFGIGGTNAHVVVEEAPEMRRAEPAREQQLLLLSARTSTALETMSHNISRYLSEHPAADLADVAFTLQVGRRRFPHRRMVVCGSHDDAFEKLGSGGTAREASRVEEASGRRVVFLFPGQSSQHPNMAREIYDSEAVFRDEVDRSCEFLRGELGIDLRTIIFPDSSTDEAAAQARLQETLIAQPAIFVIEYALSQLWMHWGVRPVACIGHSIGETVAACLAEVLSLEDALRLVAVRGRLMNSMPRGSMLTVPLPEDAIQQYLSHDIALAAVNAPTLCTLAGPTAALDTLADRLRTAGIDCLPLHTSHAFHSSMMDPVCDELEQAVREIQLSEPKLPYISNVTGTWIEKSQPLDPQYWVRHMRETVQFSSGLQRILEGSDHALLEVGPGRGLTTLTRMHDAYRPSRVLTSSLRHPQDPDSDLSRLLNAAGQLWLGGVTIDWESFHAPSRRRRLKLPTYPFERQRYWLESDGETELPAFLARQQAASKRDDTSQWLYVPSWTTAPGPLCRDLRELFAETERILIFTDACGLGSALATRLRELGQDVATVTMGPEFRQVGDREFELNVEQETGYHDLLQALGAAGHLPRTIIHLWGVTDEAAAIDEADAFEQQQQVGFYSMLHLAKAIGRHVTSPLHLLAVANGSHQLIAGETTHPAKATMLAGCKVIPQELQHVTTTFVDVGWDGHRDQRRDELVDQLAAEASTRDSNAEPVVAYRLSQRWVQRYEQLPAASAKTDRTQIKSGGVYLITGGLGGIGLRLAMSLARRGDTKLVLVGRTDIPAAEHRAAWLEANGSEDPISLRIQAIQSLEEQGAEVLVVKADVGDLAAMQNVVAVAAARFGRIDGVIHAAGDLRPETFTPVQMLDPAICRQQFRAKANGLFVLETVLADQQLDFCLLMSSLSAVLGGLTMGAYAAANLFMDAFAAARNGGGTSRWVSVAWDGWDLTDSAENATASGTPQAQAHILPDEGVQVFDHILALRRLDNIAVSCSDLDARIGQWIRLEGVRGGEATKRAAGSTSHQRPNLATEYVEPASETEIALVEIWRDLFGYDTIGIQDGFFELGGHSLLAIQMVARIRESLHINVPLVSLFEHPNIERLATFVDAAAWAAMEPPSDPQTGSREEITL